jgi:hypothetical protein
MWKAILKIKHEEEEKIVEYKFYKVSNYLKLFNDLHLIYPKYKKEYEVIFNFNFLGNQILVDDLTKYILHNDQIDITIRKIKPVYYLYDPIFNCEIVQSYNMKKLYEYAEKELNGEILLYQRKGFLNKLLDVLTKPDYYKNECINRMVKNYMF